jgi:hypothetical protein
MVKIYILELKKYVRFLLKINSAFHSWVKIVIMANNHCFLGTNDSFYGEL